MTRTMQVHLFTARSLARSVALSVVLAAAASGSRAGAAEPPYLKLAQALGTPTLANASGPKDKSLLGLNFVRRGETVSRWTKMTSVSILRVPAADTDPATRGVIGRLRGKLAAARARIRTFDESRTPPITAYFEFTAKSESDVGIVYSPHAGFVTVAQLEARGGAKIESRDVATLRHIVGK